MTIYALPDGYFYVDAAGAKQYQDNAGVEIVARVSLAVSRHAALVAWIQSIWLTGAETLVQGDGHALVGAERCLTELGIKEKLVSAGLLDPNDADNDERAVATVLYVVTDPAKVPIANKVALVRFLRLNDATTEVVWTIKVTPKPQIEASALAALVTKMLKRGIAALAASVEKTAKL